MTTLFRGTFITVFLLLLAGSLQGCAGAQSPYVFDEAGGELLVDDGASVEATLWAKQQLLGIPIEVSTTYYSEEKTMLMCVEALQVEMCVFADFSQESPSISVGPRLDQPAEAEEFSEEEEEVEEPSSEEPASSEEAPATPDSEEAEEEIEE